MIPGDGGQSQISGDVGQPQMITGDGGQPQMIPGDGGQPQMMLCGSGGQIIGQRARMYRHR